MLREWLSLLRIISRYTTSFAHYKGKLDGRRSLPPSVPVDDIANRIHQNCVAVQQVQPDVPCDQPAHHVLDWLNLKQRYYLGYLSELRNLGEEIMCNEIANLYRLDSKLKSQWCDLELRRQDAQKDLEEFDRAFPNYPSRVSLLPWVYYLLLLFIGLAELPLNMAAFQLFGEAQLMTFAVAFALALIIPASAHWVGAVFKQPFRTRVDWGMIITTCLIVGLAILGIGLVREAYLHQVGEEVNRTVTFVFIGIQLALFVGGVIASYSAHDLKRDLKQRVRKLKAFADQLSFKRKGRHKAVQESIVRWQAFVNRLRAAYLRGNREAKGPLRQLGDIQLEIPGNVFNVDEDIPRLPADHPLPSVRHAAAEVRDPSASGSYSDSEAQRSDDIINTLSKEE